MALVTKYLNACQNIHSSKELSKTTFEFLQNNFPETKVCLIQHQPKPNALEILNTNLQEPIEYWFSLLKETNKVDVGNETFENNEHLFCFSNRTFISELVYVFILKNQIDDSAKSILNAWKSLLGLVKTTNIFTEKQTINDYGNLISQLLHDVQSLMDLEAEDIQNRELLNKLEYQKKLNRSLLFYVRDFDLFKSEITIHEFIKDSLSLIDLNYDQFAFDIQNPDLEITIDVELFSEAFNQIILNAVEAVDSDFSKINLTVKSIPSSSPFINNSWVVLEIVDNGKGISEDFIPYVTKPFFTTQKYKSFCGFGLTNTKKIIEAHNGFLEINSNNGTQVKLIVPQNLYEEK